MIETKILRVLWKVVLVLVTVLCCSLANGEVIRVDVAGREDFDNIQMGIDAAVDGETVLVASGEYVITEPITFRGKAIAVRSEAGPEVTTILMSESPDNPDRACVIIFENSETEISVLEGFTISGGHGCLWEPAPGYSYQAGGGLFCSDSSPTVNDCIIADNHIVPQSQSEDTGGGVMLINSSAKITNCMIRYNSTYYWAGGMGITDGSPILADCTISQNVVLHPDGQGGGLTLNSFNDSKPILLRCTISANSAPHSAGGIQVSAFSQPTFRECLISDNVSMGGNGGILCSWWSSTTLTNCTIAGNSCVRIGGGVGCGHSAEAILTNCTITKNSAENHSGGIVSYDKSKMTVTNCIVVNNTAPSGHNIGLDYSYYHTPTSMDVSYCDIEGGQAAAHVGQGTTLNWRQGNIDTDPLFADPNIGDYHLKSEAGRWNPNIDSWIIDDVTSPCIDAGDPNSPVGLEPLPNGDRTNIGAYGGTLEAGKSPAGIIAKYSGGSGTAEDPYQIATAADLITLGDTLEDYDKHFKLMADIDLAGYSYDRALIAPDTDPNPHESGYNPSDGPAFTGVFDGNMHIISNLTITGDSYLGLFGQLGVRGTAGEVHNLGLEAVDVTGTGRHIGGLVGDNETHGRVTNCYTTGSISGDFRVGGLAGWNHGSITSSYSTSMVTGKDMVGGLVGRNAGGPEFTGTITDCYSTGMVNGTDDYVAGLVGRNLGHITSSYSTGTVNATGDYIGGIVGESSWGGSVKWSLWDMETSGQSTSSGGGIGKTTDEMQTASTFYAWACGGESIWTINEVDDYPRLWWENKPGEAIEPILSSDFLLGSGTEEDPFLVYTAEELYLVGLAACDWGGHFRLMADIDMSGFDGKDGRPSFNSIGTGGSPFAGTFDGNGHTISNLTIEGIDYVGLFGYVDSPYRVGVEHVKNLGLLNVSITASGRFVGSLMGFNSGGVISKCYSTGTVSGSQHVGGLVGCNSGDYPYRRGRMPGRITNCRSSGTVRGENRIGGLVGWNDGNIWTSYSTDTVSGNEDVGGLVGANGYRGRISQCYSTGTVSGEIRTGGLIGSNYCEWGLCGHVTNSYWDIESSGEPDMCGFQDPNATGCDNSSGKTTAEMKQQSTFEGWDFVDETANGTEDIWWIDEGKDYPRLWWELNPENW